MEAINCYISLPTMGIAVLKCGATRSSDCQSIYSISDKFLGSPPIYSPNGFDDIESMSLQVLQVPASPGYAPSASDRGDLDGPPCPLHRAIKVNHKRGI